ncbi:hypothetical protein AB0H73_34520 [Streptomyces olivoreticuli]
MFDKVRREEAGFRPGSERAPLQTPLQAPPVDRTEAATAGRAGDSPGVAANGIFGTLGGLLDTVI